MYLVKSLASEAIGHRCHSDILHAMNDRKIYENCTKKHVKAFPENYFDIEINLSR